MKYLVALVVVVALLAWLRSKRRPPARPDPSATARRAAGAGADSPDSAASAGPTPMLRCAFCGLHLPGSEALRLGDAAYCSEDHRRRHGTPSDG